MAVGDRTRLGFGADLTRLDAARDDARKPRPSTPAHPPRARPRSTALPSSDSTAVFSRGQPHGTAEGMAMKRGDGGPQLFRWPPCPGSAGVRADLLIARERVAKDLRGKLLLAAKMPVQPPFFKAGRLHDVLHRAAAEALLVEERSGLGDDSLAGGTLPCSCGGPSFQQDSEKKDASVASFAESDDERD